MKLVTKEVVNKPAIKGWVYCPICTHTVEAQVIHDRKLKVSPGQKCPRCSASLDAGYVVRVNQAA